MVIVALGIVIIIQLVGILILITLISPSRPRQQSEGSGLVVMRGLHELPAKAKILERLVYQGAISFYKDENIYIYII